MDLKVCMCDQLTEFPFLGEVNHATIGTTADGDLAQQEKVAAGSTCNARARVDDYSNFMAEIGTLNSR